MEESGLVEKIEIACKMTRLGLTQEESAQWAKHAYCVLQSIERVAAMDVVKSTGLKVHFRSQWIRVNQARNHFIGGVQ